MSPYPQSVLEDVFGYTEFRGQQQSIIEATLQGRDSLVIMPTGGGKSLCYSSCTSRRSALRSDAARYGALVLTDTSLAVLRGETPLQFREEPKRPVVASKRSAIERVVADEDLGLWQALRECRQSFASEHNVPAYVIFHDKTLQEMLAIRPQTASELLSVSGVGQTKLDRYGEHFLSVFRDEARA